MSRFVRQARWALLLAIPMLGLGCGEESSPYVGIWQGTWEDYPLSVEFRADGRAILVSGGEDGIILAVYSIDREQDPPHLDIEFDGRDWGTVRTLVEIAGPGRIRVQHLDADTARPEEFTSEAVVLERVQGHVLPRGVVSAEGLRQAMAKTLEGDIWFGGERREDLLDICEALFRHQFGHNASAAQQNAAAYFLSVKRRDPPLALLDRFAGHSPPVQPGSAFKVGNGLLLRIKRIVWLDDDTVEAKGGYYEGNVSSSGNTYRLRRERGTWKVISDKLNVIS